MKHHETTNIAAKEHLLDGHPLTRLDSIVLFGLSDLTRLISRMRKDGWVIKAKRVTYASTLGRINKFATLDPPTNLPMNQIFLTEYRLSR